MKHSGVSVCSKLWENEYLPEVLEEEFGQINYDSAEKI